MRILHLEARHGQGHQAKDETYVLVSDDWEDAPEDDIMDHFVEQWERIIHWNDSWSATAKFVEKIPREWRDEKMEELSRQNDSIEAEIVLWLMCPTS